MQEGKEKRKTRDRSRGSDPIDDTDRKTKTENRSYHVTTQNRPGEEERAKTNNARKGGDIGAVGGRLSKRSFHELDELRLRQSR